MEFDVDNAHITEEEAYRLCYPMAYAPWIETMYDTGDTYILRYYNYILRHTGYFAICGAKGCIRACMMQLEKQKRIGNLFHNEFRRKPAWNLENKINPDEMKGAINPWREEFLEKTYPELQKNEQTRLSNR